MIRELFLVDELPELTERRLGQVALSFDGANLSATLAIED
jgi:hypothetical protein